MTPAVALYNPRLLDPDRLDGLLVGRDDLVQEILEDLRRQGAGAPTRQHWLLRGPRGSGKTHLLGVVYHRVKRDPALGGAFLPVWMPETAAYQVYSAGSLLTAIGHQLLEELRQSPEEGTEELAGRLRDLVGGGDDPALFEQAAELLQEAAGRRKRVLLVLLENFDAVLAGFPAPRRKEESRRLRALLQHEPEFLFLCTTSIPNLPGLADPREALFGHLKERRLEPLSEEEFAELFRKLATVAGGARPATVLWTDVQRGKVSHHDLEGRSLLPSPVATKVLCRVVGGNPRSGVAAFQELAGGAEAATPLAVVLALLDRQTAFFEAQLSHLAPRERSILSVICLAPGNLTLHEIAERARLPERQLPTQVERLIAAGHVVPAGRARGRGRRYAAADPLFRLWCQFRGQGGAVHAVLHFLTGWADWLQSPALADPLAELGLVEWPAAHGGTATRDPQGLEFLMRTVRTNYELAKEALRAGKLAEAEIRVRDICLDAQSTDPKVHDEIRRAAELVHACLLWRLGRGDEAVAALERMAALGGGTASPLSTVSGNLLCARGVLGMVRFGIGKETEGKVAITDFVRAIAQLKDADTRETMHRVFRWSLGRLPLPPVRSALEFVASSISSSLPVESALLHGILAGALATVEAPGSSSIGVTPEARLRTALARVPPELARTAEEAVAFLHGARPGPAGGADLNLDAAFARLQRHHVKEALRRTGGNKREAADLLGISVQWLHNLLMKFGMR